MAPELITFDCYGTLIDWNRGIVRAFHDQAARQGLTLEPEPVLAAYHEVEPEVEGGEFRPYREVLTEVGRRVARTLGWSLSADRRDFLAESLPDWPPFADANPALERLNTTGFRLGVLSNVDDDLLADTLRHFTVAFDLMVTAEQVESYKPAPAHFRRALEEVGEAPERMLHVAASYFHDVRPARALGIPTVWVNRTGRARPEGPAPTVEVDGLEAAVDWIERRTRG